MQPKNKTERTKAFVNFLLLFILCIVIILTTAFFSIQVPFEQNNKLRKQIYIVQRDREFTYDFMTEMSAITGMLDTINTKANKREFLDADISKSIIKLNEKVNADSIYDKILYQHIVQNLYDLQLAKKQLHVLTTKENNLNDLQKQNEDLRAKVDKAKDDYDKLYMMFTQPR